MKKPLFIRLAALLIGLLIAASAVDADDLDIYTNPSANSVKPPYTVLVLDLNLLGICNSTLTQTTNPNNPDAPQLCLNITSSIVLSDLLGGITSNPAALLTNLLTGSYGCTTGTLSSTCSNNAAALCNLYGLMGLVSPIIPIPGLTLLLSSLLGGVTSLSCGTLSFLLSVPLVSTLLNSIMSGFVGQLVSGLVNPLLTTVVGQLPVAIVGILNSTFSGILNAGQVSLIALLQSILSNLINTNVAIMVSHADRSNAGGAPASTCSFADLASIPGPRRTTAGCSNGAYMLIGFTPLVDQGTVTTLLTKVTTLLTNMLNPTNLLNSVTALLSTALTTPTQLLPPYQGKEVYAELTHYLAGNDVYNAPLARWDGLTGLLTRDTTIETAGGSYIKPALECRTANVLNVMLTNNVRDTESDATLRAYFPGLPSSGAITLGNVVQQAQSPGFTDSAGRSINLKSYFLIQNLLTSTSTLANAGATILTYADSLGLLGLGKQIASLLKPTLSVDASLLTPSQTLDLYRPGRVLGGAFFGLFRPADAKLPRWPGDLKKLTLQLSNNTYSYVDVNGAAAIDTDGRIKTSALTYWTDSGQLGSGVSSDGRNASLGGAGQKIPGFKFGGGGDPGRSNTSGKRKLFYDSHYVGTSSGTQPYLRAFDESTYTSVCGAAPYYLLAGTLACVELTSALDSAGKESHELLLYARGYEVGTASASKGVGSDLVGRDWLHGAVLHSRPVAINYGARSGHTKDNPDIRVVYGAADGYFRMIDNGTGAESWAFMPRAVMKTQKTLRNNVAGGPLPYGVDGAPTVLLIDRDPNGGPGDGIIDSNNPYDKAYVFFGLRRGGNLSYFDNHFYYGFDVTNPDSPKLMWRIGGIGSVGASDDNGLFNTGSNTGFRGVVQDSVTYLWFTKLAFTFSSPKVGRLRIKSGNTTSTKDVLIFGGGYYGGHTTTNLPAFKDQSGMELDSPTDVPYDIGQGKVLGNDQAGEGVYIVDALSGELIWKSTALAGFTDEPGLIPVMRYDNNYRVFYHPMLQDSIAADVAVVDSDGDGYTDRLYATDTGGRLWRANLPGSDVSKWTMEPLASVGRHPYWSTLAPYGYPTTKVNDRRFLQAPDYVPYRGANGAYDAIVFASGDREAPLNTTTQNYLYVYRDAAINTVQRNLTDIVQTETDSRLVKHGDFADLGTACADGAATCTAGKNLSIGWKIPLSGKGEKAMSQPLASNGVIFLSTYVPNDTTQSSCQPSEGNSKLYAVALTDSRPTSFLTDNGSDGDKRSMATRTPGLPGEFTPLNAMSVTANTETFDPHNRRYYDIYWRERRGDEETQVPRN